VENGQLLTASLKGPIAEANAALPDPFHRQSAWLAEHKPVRELNSNGSSF